jgi:amino acid transporter
MKNKPTSTLVQGIGTFGALALVFGSMIGSGAFKKITVMSQDLGSPAWVMLAWALAGGITLIGALCKAEVAPQIASALYSRPALWDYLRREADWIKSIPSAPELHFDVDPIG